MWWLIFFGAIASFAAYIGILIVWPKAGFFMTVGVAATAIALASYLIASVATGQ